MAADRYWLFHYWVSFWVGAAYQQPASHWIGEMAGLGILPPALIVGDIEELPLFFAEQAPILQQIVEQGATMIDAEHRKVILDVRYQ